MSAKRQRKGQPGDIVAIDLGNGYEGYACVLDPPLIGFYNIQARQRLSVDQITASEFMFKLFVYDKAITSGRWVKIARVSVAPNLRQTERFFRQDIQNGKFYIYIDGEEETPAAREDVDGLEAAAVWSAEHVEDRIQDYHKGVENKWALIVHKIKSLQIYGAFYSVLARK